MSHRFLILTVTAIAAGLLLPMQAQASAGFHPPGHHSTEWAPILVKATVPTTPKAWANAIDNPWFPLPPGKRLIYTGIKDGKRADREVEVTAKTKDIGGVTCVVVEDRVSLSGKSAEKTISYYAQDTIGNVWLFGEDSLTLNSEGKVVGTKSWRAGTDGAEPAFVMEAAPTVGDAFAHKYTKGNFEVLSTREPVKVPYKSFDAAVMIKEWSSEEPDVLSHKFYVQGIGEVRDVTVKGDPEELLLVKVAP